MARSSSIISVSIIGDAKKLIGAVDQADAKTGGLVKSAVRVGVASAGIKKGFDLIGDSLGEADRRGDAIFRLEDALGDLSKPLIEASDHFTDIGASSQDVIELEATFADLASSAGLAAPFIAENAEAIALSALAAAQVHDEDPTAIIEAIGKAAGGSTRGLKPYGIDLTEAAVEQRALQDTGKELPKMLTDTELAAARTALIIEGFSGVVAETTGVVGDHAQQQDEFGAKLETVAGKVGGYIEGPAAGLLDWVNDMVDAIPNAVEGWQMLGEVIEDSLRNIATPIARASDVVREFLRLVGLAESKEGAVGSPFSKTSDRDVSAAVDRHWERNGLGR